MTTCLPKNNGYTYRGVLEIKIKEEKEYEFHIKNKKG